MSAGRIPRCWNLFTYWESPGSSGGRTDRQKDVGLPPCLSHRTLGGGCQKRMDALCCPAGALQCRLFSESGDYCISPHSFYYSSLLPKVSQRKYFSGDGAIVLVIVSGELSARLGYPCGGGEESLSQPTGRAASGRAASVCLAETPLSLRLLGDGGRRAEGFRSALLLPVNT